jgi:hypothetical protein
MTTIFTTFVYLDAVDPTKDNGAGLGRVLVKLFEPLPTKRHTNILISVHSVDLPIPNTSNVFVPRKLRINCSTPSVAQSPTTYNNTLLQLYTAQHLLAIPGDFSTISYRDSSSSGTAVTLLDGQLQCFVIYFSDVQDKLFVPPLPFDIVLKIELVRSFEAELLEQINKLVAGQNLLLLHQHLTNPLETTNTAYSETYQQQGDIYGPIDNL